ncbi:TonB-dependent siderophore receptor [Phascolarctobacterium succinatutens]|uniref:TonB-dependent receptor n=2 Tax=Phascolarctobacterium succinatutens TaxID=626940 RepID=UPI003077A84B
MMKNKKALVMSVLCAVASVGFVMSASAAEQTMHGNLDEVVVEGRADVLPGGMASKEASMGILGNKDVMDVPFQTTTLTEKTITTFGGPNQPLQSVLINNPAVRSVGTTLHNDFSIRGLKSTGSSLYVNGIPGLMTQFWAPSYIAEDIQFISGPNSGISGLPSSYETSSAGGIVNFVSKKATDNDINRYKQTFSGKSSFGEYIDIGRRFGENKEWGVRINTEWLDGKTAIDNHDMEAQGIFANIDHKDDNSKSNLLMGYRHLNIEGGARWFTLKNANGKPVSDITKVPSAPDAGKNYGIPGLAKEAEGYIFALNHEQKFADGWKWFANAGYNYNKLNRNIIGASSNFTIINDKGDIANNLMSTQTVTKNYYAQLGINGQFKTGDLEHDVTLAADKAWHSIKGAKDMYKDGSMGSVAGNLYNGIYGVGVWFPKIEPGLSSKDQYWGISLADTVKYNKAQLLLGVHKHAASVDSYNKKTEKVTGHVDSNAVCPTYGFVYQPDEHVSMYASHSENFDKGSVVSGTYENSGEILDPAKTKQNEFGVKYENAGFVTSLGVFDITQSNNIVVHRDGYSKDFFLQDGEAKYKGIELSVNGKLAPKWNVMGGFMYLDAEQHKTARGTNDGKAVNGVARWNAVAALEYQADDNFSVIGRGVYVGKADIFNESLQVPSHMTYDLGVNYKTKINATPVTFSAMCYNLTDKNYWDAHTGNGLILSNPRTFMLSAQFDI